MKINWGTGIFLSYSLFVVFIMTFVYLSTQQKIELVTSDYYAEELQYQGKIDSRERANALAENLNWRQLDSALTFSFPKEFEGQKITGTIHLMRPSDQKLDREISINPSNELSQMVDAAKLTKGLYLVKVDWEVGGDSYFTEGSLFVN